MDGMTLAGIAVAVLVIIGLIVATLSKGTSEDVKPTIELHPAQLKFMEEKEAKYCSGNSKGKGIRCIIDYMREATTEQAQQILSETPKFSEGFQTLAMDVYSQQFDWLSELGIKLGDGQGAEKYSDYGRAFRAMLDYAIRAEKEGKDDLIEDIYGNVRCLNC